MQKHALLLTTCLLLFALVNQGCASIAPLGTEYAPKAAYAMAEQMDAQILMRGNAAQLPKREYEKKLTTYKDQVSDDELLALRQRELRQSITIMSTVPVNVNNLKLSCALARQMTEEINTILVSAGYRVQEIRKGKEILFQEQTGEMLLTRDTSQLAKRHVSSVAVLTGTYVITPEQVRFSMRLLHTPSNEVLAMASATVPITPDVRPLLEENTEPTRISPSVNTRLR